MDKPKLSIETDEKYYRVILKYDTHKLHSEKLNLETASKLLVELDTKLGITNGD